MNLSRAAVRRADSLLDGRASEFFQINSGGDVLQLRRVRFSAKTGRRVRGGRYANKFAADAIRGSDVGKFWDEAHDAAAEQLKADPSIKRLNRRAVAVAAEIAYRQRAAKGHTLAVQWLPQVYKTRRSATVKNGPLIVRSTRGIPLGRVDFMRGADGNLTGATISGFVPGTAKVMAQHAVLSRVEAARIIDRQVYINKQLSIQGALAGLKRA